MSTKLVLACSVASAQDIVLGADWLTECRIAVSSNTIRQPPHESVLSMADEHVWKEDGTLETTPNATADHPADRFLPFSLLHTREDQFCFSNNNTSLWSGLSPPPYPVPAQVQGNPFGLAGFHEQAVLDANCQSISFSSSMPSVVDNVTSRDTPAILNTKLILERICACLVNRDTSFWAEVEADHPYHVDFTDVGAFRACFIRHIYSGECAQAKGTGCRKFTCHQSPQVVAIALIDTTLQWLQEGVLAMDDFAYICSALDITMMSKEIRKSLKVKFRNRRHEYLDMIAAASLSLRAFASVE